MSGSLVHFSGCLVQQLTNDAGAEMKEHIGPFCHPPPPLCLLKGDSTPLNWCVGLSAWAVIPIRGICVWGHHTNCRKERRTQVQSNTCPCDCDLFACVMRYVNNVPFKLQIRQNVVTPVQYLMHLVLYVIVCGVCVSSNIAVLFHWQFDGFRRNSIGVYRKSKWLSTLI